MTEMVIAKTSPTLQQTLLASTSLITTGAVLHCWAIPMVTICRITLSDGFGIRL